jgi:nitroreductase
MSETTSSTNRAATEAWSISEHEFPKQGTTREQLRFLLNYAILAPSGHNTQPWLFRLADDGIEIYADRRRALAVVDPGDRELAMSCGTALFHLRVAVRHFGYIPVLSLLPRSDHPDLMARIRLGTAHEPTLNDHRLFMAIKKRRTNRQPFEDRAVPSPELDHLAMAAHDEGATLHVVRRAARKRDLAALIAEGDRRQASNPSFRRELAAWIHSNRSESRDGLPGTAFGFGDLLSYAGPFVVRTFNWGEGQAAHDHQLAEGSPVLLVFTTPGDDPVDWLRAGQALDRVLLQARAYDLHASYLNQPIEVPALRPRVAQLLDTEEHPQLVLRMGYGAQVKPTPRRPVEEMIINEPPPM